jgi:hypothetical protein
MSARLVGWLPIPVSGAGAMSCQPAGKSAEPAGSAWSSSVAISAMRARSQACAGSMVRRGFHYDSDWISSGTYQAISKQLQPEAQRLTSGSLT